MTRKEQVERITKAWETLDRTKIGSKESQQAWAVVDALSRTSTKEELREGSRKTKPWWK